MIVVDASAVLELLLGTPKAEQVAARLRRQVSLHAPHLIDLEVAQVLRRYVLGGALDMARAGHALSHLAALGIERCAHDASLARIWQHRHHLTAYDAAYVALAEVLDAPLVTCDRRLAAAPHRARVEVVGPGE